MGFAALNPSYLLACPSCAAVRGDFLQIAGNLQGACLERDPGEAARLEPSAAESMAGFVVNNNESARPPPRSGPGCQGTATTEPVIGRRLALACDGVACGIPLSCKRPTR